MATEQSSSLDTLMPLAPIKGKKAELGDNTKNESQPNIAVSTDRFSNELLISPLVNCFN